MKLKKLLIAGLVSTTSLSVLAFIGTKQAEISNFKPFAIIIIVALILGVVAYYQKQLQHH
ncbi:hypothetical protein MNB_SUP05-SYMBIONT-5-1154 [hydrothermal vent metagenome]|uniref:Uncharacterized protein n=1 Tax=hydrothermal vent metagenome TaxID=652676 RepID=A0A1W1E197_9ZZZZ